MAKIKSIPLPPAFSTLASGVRVCMRVCLCVNLTVTKNNDFQEPGATKRSPIFIKTSLS